MSNPLIRRNAVLHIAANYSKLGALDIIYNQDFGYSTPDSRQ